MNPIGISILTNGKRRKYLEKCISSLLENCYYRPLIIGIFNNGSSDDTTDYLSNLPEVYGVEWRVEESKEDKGCASGTNRSIRMVADCELQIHLESDFELLSPEDSGCDRMWLHRAVEFMSRETCDYIYLRRMRNHEESAMHWWSQWMPRVTKRIDEYMECPPFWWSNNPVLFRTQALYDSKTLPLDTSIDGAKGTAGWSQPELNTASPPNTWLHKWGLFIHERREDEDFSDRNGCGKYGPFGTSGCKYGFWYGGDGNNFCRRCDHTKDFTDMWNHERRKRAVKPREKVVAFHSNQLGYRGTEVGSYNYAHYNEEILGNRSVFLAPRNDKNIALERFEKRFTTLVYDNWVQAEQFLQEQNADVLHMRKAGDNDGLLSKSCWNVVHCAFPILEPHGDAYCYISEWLARKASGGKLPFIPHIVEKPEPVEGFRKEWGIPEDANVFGWIGAPDSFNLPAGIDTVRHLANDGKSYFVFVGIPKFIDSPQVIFKPITWDVEFKRRFIFTCDAMLHSRYEGETFGLAVAEFSAAGRPVLVWHSGIGLAHLEMLGDKAIHYAGSHDLIPTIENWKYDTGPHWDAYTEKFSPENVMAKFKEVCRL